MARLEKGEKLRVKAEPEFPGFAVPKSIRAILIPLRYDELQDTLVSKQIRAMPQYNGYRLYVYSASKPDGNWRI
jgi:hypothetical protein